MRIPSSGSIRVALIIRGRGAQRTRLYSSCTLPSTVDELRLSGVATQWSSRTFLEVWDHSLWTLKLGGFLVHASPLLPPTLRACSVTENSFSGVISQLLLPSLRFFCAIYLHLPQLTRTMAPALAYPPPCMAPYPTSTTPRNPDTLPNPYKVPRR